MPGDANSPLLDRGDARVLVDGQGRANRVTVPAVANGMVCSGDTVTVPVPVTIPQNAAPGSTLRVDLSEVTDGVEWDPAMAAQRVWLPVFVTG